MLKLLDGIIAFRATLTLAAQENFTKLALGQFPDAVFIGCSDSRSDPHHFASTNPGDVFVTRTIGNFVPANGAAAADPVSASTLAVIEYALLQLRVSHIIVCGHSECGAMLALLNGIQLPPEDAANAPHIGAWLENGRRSLKRLEKGVDPNLDQELLTHNQLSQINVLEQIDHLRLHPLVRKRLEAGALQLHGWWFEIATASVYAYEEDKRRFTVIDEQHADRIRARVATIRKIP
jgi:carbonic anhydrase